MRYEGSLITALAWSIYEPVANHLTVYCKGINNRTVLSRNSG